MPHVNKHASKARPLVTLAGTLGSAHSSGDLLCIRLPVHTQNKPYTACNAHCYGSPSVPAPPLLCLRQPCQCPCLLVTKVLVTWLQMVLAEVLLDASLHGLDVNDCFTVSAAVHCMCNDSWHKASAQSSACSACKPLLATHAHMATNVSCISNNNMNFIHMVHWMICMHASVMRGQQLLEPAP